MFRVRSRVLSVLATFGLSCLLLVFHIANVRGQDHGVASPQVAVLPILVVSQNGRPIEGVKVVPWALGCGQGHGVWGPFEGKPDESGMEPASVVTNEQGIARVRYPFFRDANEKTRTLVVSVRLEHPDYSSADAEHIEVPLKDDQPYSITMTLAATVEIVPSIDGQPVPLENLYAVWSNARSWQANSAPINLASGKLRIGGFLPGPNSFFVVRLLDDSVTHFSDFQYLHLEEGGVTEVSCPLLPAVEVKGKLSDRVPRPVRDGRVVARTLPAATHDGSVMWMDWAPVAEDGSFTITAWPAGQSIQLIALCDGFIATSGKPPVKELEFENDGYHRPHAFDVEVGEIEIPMMPLVPVSVNVTDEQNVPVGGLDVATSPNVGWWNYGSQIYALNMVQGRNLIRERDYRRVVENPYPNMFRGVTNSLGKVTFQLPAGRQYFELLSDEYELPVELGRRARQPVVEKGKPLELTLRVQPVGTEMLGDWDKLAGVVYGCSTVEGRRILALPGMKEKCDAFVERFSDAKNQKDPALLAEAYLILADAFLSIDDKDEALKWRRKASEQRGK